MANNSAAAIAQRRQRVADLWLRGASTNAKPGSQAAVMALNVIQTMEQFIAKLEGTGAPESTAIAAVVEMQ